MRKVLISIILSTLYAMSASAAKLQEVIDRTVDVRSGVTVSVDNTNGSVTVTSWDQPRVRIHAVKKVSGGSEESAREALAQLKVDIRTTADAVIIDTKYPHQNGTGFLDFLMGDSHSADVSYELTVPRAANVKLETVNGAIRLSDVNGSADLETTNGRVEVIRCAGTVDADTTNGAIRVELTQVTPGKAMKFETTNGGITLVVPSSLAATVDAETTNGSIHADLPITTRDFSKHAVRGTINGGGPELSLHTTNGSIEIKAPGLASK